MQNKNFARSAKRRNSGRPEGCPFFFENFEKEQITLNVTLIIRQVIPDAIVWFVLIDKGISMLRKYMRTVCLALVLLGAGIDHAAEINLATNSLESGGTSGDTYVFSSTGGVIPGGSTGDYRVNSSDTLVIGADAGGGGAGFTLNADLTIVLDSSPAPSSFSVVGAGSGDVTLSIRGLNINNGGTATFGSAATTQHNVTVSGGDLTIGAKAATMDFYKNSTVTFSSVTENMLGNTGKATINLQGGALGFTNSSSLTLGNGSINVSEDSTLAAKGGLILGAKNDVAGSESLLDIHAGKELTILKEVGSSALGSLTVGKAGSNGGTLKLGAGSTLNVGALIFDVGGTLDDAGADTDTSINAGSLQIKTDFVDSATITTSVTGLTTIDSGVTYTVKGTTNVYSGGMLVKGTLLGDDGAAITLGSSLADLKTIQVDGGSIKAQGAGDFTINFADVVITKSGSDPALDASDGKLNLANSTLTVNMATAADAATINATSGIAVNSYRQLVGNIDLLTTGAGQMTVSGAAVIGSGSASQKVTLDVSGNAANFVGGLTLDNYGAISSTNSDGTVTVGNGVINANGNNHLDADSKTLTINTASGSTGRMNWNGTGNTVSGNVVQKDFDVNVGSLAQLTISSSSITKGYEVGSLTVSGKLGLGTASDVGVIESNGNVTVKSGGSLFANNDAYLYSVGGGSNVLKVDKGGTLSAANGTINARDFKSVDINGTYIVGLANGAATPVESSHLIANSDITVGSSGLITMTAELASVASASQNVNDATILLKIDNSAGTNFTITNNANMSSMSMLGKYQFGLNSDASILYLTDASGKVILDGSDADRWQAIKNLQDMWGKNQIKDDLGNVIYDVVKGDIVAYPEDSLAGNKNINILGALASPESNFVGLDTLEYINGAHLFGVTDVAMETNRTFTSDMSSRTKALGCSFVAARESFGSDALASTAMNDILFNRFWFGGSGLKQNADGDDGFSGYKYKSYGFVGGYDRVAAENTAGGFSFAYNKGDYEDKGTAEHDSEIESFSVGLYGTHSNPCGWFVSGHGGYTYSQNDIRELRRDPDAGRYSWAESNFRTNTWSFGALFGYDLRIFSDSLVITPSVGMNYIIAKNSDHDSTLDGIATQRVLGVKNQAVYAPVELGIQYDRHLGLESKLRVELNAGYAYNFRGSGMTGSINFLGLDPDTFISVHGPDNTRHSYKIGGGTRYSHGAFDLGLRYDYAARSNYHAHRLMATAGFSF